MYWYGRGAPYDTALANAYYQKAGSRPISSHVTRFFYPQEYSGGKITAEQVMEFILSDHSEKFFKTKELIRELKHPDELPLKLAARIYITLLIERRWKLTKDEKQLIEGPIDNAFLSLLSFLTMPLPHPSIEIIPQVTHSLRNQQKEGQILPVIKLYAYLFLHLNQYQAVYEIYLRLCVFPVSKPYLIFF